jgi:hypothetical protein
VALGKNEIVHLNQYFFNVIYYVQNMENLFETYTIHMVKETPINGRSNILGSMDDLIFWDFILSFMANEASCTDVHCIKYQMSLLNKGAL